MIDILLLNEATRRVNKTIIGCGRFIGAASLSLAHCQHRIGLVVCVRKGSRDSHHSLWSVRPSSSIEAELIGVDDKISKVLHGLRSSLSIRDSRHP